MRTKRCKMRGSAILVVLGIVAVVSIVCAMLGMAASQQMHSSQITRDAMKARMIAESGLNQAYHSVKTNFALVKGYGLSESFDGGTYTVRSGALTGSSEDRAQLISEGKCGLGRSVVVADLENRKRVSSDADDADKYFNLLFDLLVGGTLDLKGNFKVDVSQIHANGNVTIQGSAEVDAKTVSSAGTVTWKKPDGTVVTLNDQSPVEILTAALGEAINEFIQYAKDHNSVYASGAQIPTAPECGVAYCTGDPSGWSRTGTGCFIFAGDASFQGNAVNVSSANGYPALIVLGTGEVKFNSGTEIHGAILIPNGSARVNGHSAFYGAILVGQGMTGNGTADLYAGTGQGFNLPPNETSSDNVVITAWH